MPRANRHRLPGHAWHITHRCHNREFLLRHPRDRRRWRYWLFQARKRYRLCVLNYIVTCNHIHLLVLDRGNDEIPRSMQLIAGRTAQEYNERKSRRGAFWEDRYHATAIETEDHLGRCLIYIDLNMVRAGAVVHPGHWDVSGYCETIHPPQRYRTIDLPALMRVLAIENAVRMRRARARWVENALGSTACRREESWSSSVAVGSREFVENFQSQLGSRALRHVFQTDGEEYCLQEPPGAYSFNL